MLATTVTPAIMASTSNRPVRLTEAAGSCDSKLRQKKYHLPISGSTLGNNRHIQEVPQLLTEPSGLRQLRVPSGEIRALKF